MKLEAHGIGTNILELDVIQKARPIVIILSYLLYPTYKNLPSRLLEINLRKGNTITGRLALMKSLIVISRLALTSLL